MNQSTIELERKKAIVIGATFNFICLISQSDHVIQINLEFAPSLAEYFMYEYDN